MQTEVAEDADLTLVKGYPVRAASSPVALEEPPLVSTALHPALSGQGCFCTTGTLLIPEPFPGMNYTAGVWEGVYKLAFLLRCHFQGAPACRLPVYS